MADLKPQVYKDPRPAAQFARFHERARTRPVGWTYELVRLVVTWSSILLYRVRAIGTENVPAAGPAILAPNHFSNWDHFLAGILLRRKVRFMSKSQLFSNPIITYILTVGGVFPVRRGHHDEEAFVTSYTILRHGGCLLIYPEGGRSRTGGLRQPKPGVGRLALESGVPVVPVAVHGSLAIRRWRRLHFPKVTVQYGEPLRFPVVADPTREQQQRAAERIFEPVRRMYEALDAEGRRGVIRRRRAERRRRAARTA